MDKVDSGLVGDVHEVDAGGRRQWPDARERRGDSQSRQENSSKKPTSTRANFRCEGGTIEVIVRIIDRMISACGTSTASAAPGVERLLLHSLQPLRDSD